MTPATPGSLRGPIESADAEAAKYSREAKIGAVAVGAVVTTRVVGGNFIANDWEGWGTFIPSATGAAIEGLILGGLVFGLVVRRAARSPGGRPAFVGAILGILALLSLAIPYSAPQAILGAGAVALGLAAAERVDDRPRTRRIASAAIAFGLIVIVAWLSFVGVTFVTGDWPDVSP